MFNTQQNPDLGLTQTQNKTTQNKYTTSFFLSWSNCLITQNKFLSIGWVYFSPQSCSKAEEEIKNVKLFSINNALSVKTQRDCLFSIWYVLRNVRRDWLWSRAWLWQHEEAVVVNHKGLTMIKHKVSSSQERHWCNTGSKKRLEKNENNS